MLSLLGEEFLMQGQLERSAAFLEESLEPAVEVGSKARVAGGLEGLAEVALAHGQPARTARLWGATEAMREAIDLSVSFFDHSHYDYEERLAAARAQLDETAWEAAWAEGRAMSPDEAVEYALKSEESAPPPKESADLSERELEVLRLVADGLTDPHVASRFYISPRTVSFHLSSVFRKLGRSLPRGRRERGGEALLDLGPLPI